MSDWAVVWLAVMAVSLVIMASVQIGLIIVALKVGREATRAVTELRKEISPLVEKAHRVVDDAAKATALAALQVERLDGMLSTTASRVDQIMGVVQNAMGGPIRKGFAAWSVIRAVVSAFRRPSSRARSSQGHPHDDEDALFVG